MIIAGNQSHFLRLVKAMEMEWLLEDERFAKQEVRFEHAAEIEEIVAGWVASHELDELRKILDAAGIVSAKVENLRDVAENPQLRHRGKLVKLCHPVMGR